MSKSTLKILPALMVAITALVAQPVFGGAITHELIFTETSSTDLTVTYDGNSLVVNPVPNNPDTWNFQFSVMSVPDARFAWAEPGSNLVNGVFFAPALTGAVVSDRDPVFFTETPINADGARIQVGTDGGVAVFATFHDLGDVATVPDTGTTFSLFGLSLTGLGFLRRKLC
jgi:VPDSG-CTERM motif